MKPKKSKRAFVWDYSEKSDILNIHKKENKVDGSAELGDFTLDFNKKGEVIGVEIINVSDFLEQAGIKRSLIQEIENIELSINRRSNLIYVWVRIKLPEIEKNIPLPVPLMH